MWAWPSGSSLVLALLLALPLALMDVAAAQAQEEASSFSHRMAQGRFFRSQGLLRQALAEFEAAALLPDGQTDVEVHHLIARSRYQLGDVSLAVDAARTAAALKERMPPEVAEFHEFLTTRFGKVLIIGARMEGASRPEPVTPLLDPELKRAFESAVERLDAGGTGSTSIYLPVGSYRVAGHIVDVKPTGATRMDLRPTVGASNDGVYGERRGDRRTSAPRKKPKRAAQRHSPPTGQARPAPIDVGGALDLRVGGLGYGQQGNGSAGLRGSVGGELLLGHRLGLRGSLLVGGWRAERIQVLADDPLATGAPPALLLEGSVAASFLATISSGILLGPELSWAFGISAPIASLLPDGYLGPRTYFVQGPEVGLRTIFGNATVKARPEVAVKALVREHWPLGTLLPADSTPHLSVGASVEIGVRVR
jgi:hypothetical protein